MLMCIFENKMHYAKTIAKFAILVIVLALSSIGAIQPGRAIGMNLYSYFQNWNFCLGGNSNYSTWLYYDAGPSSKTWVVTVDIGLNGGDNTQYAHWFFDIFDHGSGGNLVAEYAGAQYNWIAQGIVFGSTLTASLAGSLTLEVSIGNPDSASQCFSVQATSWYY